MQKDLFGNIIEPKPVKGAKSTGFNWSYSRYEVYESCEKKYYYTYYGSKKTKALKEPLKAELAVLADIDNRYMVMGDVVHSVIAWALRKLKNHESVEYFQIRNFAFSKLRETVGYSERFRLTGRIETFAFPVPLIKEIVHDINPFLEIEKELEEKIMLNLNNFWHSETFESLRKNATYSDSIIEGKSNFQLDKRVNVTGKIDLAFPDGENYVITDWKTGKTQYEETSLQLLTYGLWSKSQSQISDKSLIIQKAYLAQDTIEPMKFSENQLLRAKAKIRQQTELLKEMDEFGMNATAEAFVARKMERICKLCPFEKICYK
jgi:hypothetical protein